MHVSVITQQVPHQWINYPSGIDYTDAVTLKEILYKLDALDKKLGAPDCTEDAAKVPFLKQLEDRIKALEKKVGKPK